MTWTEFLAGLPLIAILRGVRPEEAADIGLALYEAGFRCVEVPLNSPLPLQSIAALARSLDDRMLIGAGTVLRAGSVAEIADAGGRLVVSPNTDEEVIAATRKAGLTSLPAFLSPTEAFAAVKAGAHGLKLFPAEAASPSVLKAVKAVLPKEIPVFPVGGVDPHSLGPYLAAGAAGFGVGSAVYRPGHSAEQTHRAAAAFVAAWREATTPTPTAVSA